MTMKIATILGFLLLRGLAFVFWAHSTEPQLTKEAERNAKGWAGTFVLLDSILTVALVLYN